MKMHMRDIGCHLIDCGSVRRNTRGMPIGFFREVGPPPFNLTFIHV
jgi:hypothetical protein